MILGIIGTPPCSARPPVADCIPADGGATSSARCTSRPTARSLSATAMAATGTLSLRAQDINRYSGKILRINTTARRPSNPFYDGTNSIHSKVWLYGCGTLSVSTSTRPAGRVFGDVGWNTWEEVDRGTRRNYGWPCYEGAGAAAASTRATLHASNLPASSVTPPFYTYTAARAPVDRRHASTPAPLYPAGIPRQLFFRLAALDPAGGGGRA